MTKAMRSALDGLAENGLMQALFRFLLSAIAPVLSAACIWAAVQITGLDRRVAIMEAARADVRAQVFGRLDALEKANAEDSRNALRLSTDVATLLATQAALMRAVERVEHALDSLPNRNK